MSLPYFGPWTTLDFDYLITWEYRCLRCDLLADIQSELRFLGQAPVIQDFLIYTDVARSQLCSSNTEQSIRLGSPRRQGLERDLQVQQGRRCKEEHDESAFLNVVWRETIGGI